MEQYLWSIRMHPTTVNIIVFLITFSFSFYATAEKPQEWRLALCYGKAASVVDTKYRQVVADTSARVFAYANNADFKMQARQCPIEPDLSCYADSTAIYCREEPLAQLARVAAWLSADAAIQFNVSKLKPRSLNFSSSLSWVDALLLAHAEAEDGDEVFNNRARIIASRRDIQLADLNEIYELVIDIYTHTNNQLEAAPNNDMLRTAMKLYESVLNYAFAFLLGHESYHYYKNQCPLLTPSKIEENGLVDSVIKMQLRGGYFDPAISIDKHEARADICAFRWLEEVAQSTKSSDSPILDALSKTIAIDVMASPIIAGYLQSIDQNTLSQDAPIYKLVDGYLYPQSRLILSSATLHYNEKTYPASVKLCGQTARAMVHLMQAAISNYPDSSGEISDDILTQFPSGVVKAWNGGVWSDQSFNCSQGEIN